MKKVICLMGNQCSGMYVIEKYLVEAYSIFKFKGYTTRSKKSNETDDNYHFITLDEMLNLDQRKKLLSIREYNGEYYGKNIDDIHEGISVCVIDYDGYLELSTKVETIPVFIERYFRHRYVACNIEDVIRPYEFIQRDESDSEQFLRLKNDKNITIIRYKGLNNTKLSIDSIVEPLIDDIKMYNIFRAMFIED